MTHVVLIEDRHIYSTEYFKEQLLSAESNTENQVLGKSFDPPGPWKDPRD